MICSGSGDGKKFYGFERCLRKQKGQNLVIDHGG